MFGSALKNPNPWSINGKLGDMAISIVRDRVANMSLDDILKNRNKLRNGVKEEIQKLLTGWGIWLETVEIQDVKILSSSLFRNLQTEFREKSRIDAERISAQIQKQITEEELARNLKRQKADYEYDINYKKEQAQQRVVKQKQEAEKFEQELKIEQKRRDIRIQKEIRELEMTMDNTLKKQEMDFRTEQLQNELLVKEEKERQDLLKAKFETDMIEHTNMLSSQDKRKQIELDQLKQDLELKNTYYT